MMNPDIEMYYNIPIFQFTTDVSWCGRRFKPIDYIIVLDAQSTTTS